MAVTFEELISQLEQERKRILAELEGMDEHPRHTVVGYGNHQADDASDAFDQAAELALRQHAERLLDMIEEALRRSDAGTYGYCVKCGEPIDHARLKAIPYADLCIDCAEHPVYH